MAKGKSGLTSKQRKFLGDIFKDNNSIDEALQKHGISYARYCIWFTQKTFGAEFSRRLNIEWINSKVILVKYANFAAAKLIELIQNGKGEIARKACNDILAYQFKELRLIEKPPETDEPAKEEDTLGIPDWKAVKILSILADEKMEMENS